MEQSKPIIRLATSNDAENICQLFSRVIPEYDRKIDFWVWINRLLSQEKSIIAIAELKGDIIGHYAIIPQEVVLLEQKFRVGFGVHAVIDSNINSGVSIFQISSFAYKKASELGLKFLYGFPNLNYRLIQEKIERWQKVALFRAHETDLYKYKLDIDINGFKIDKFINSYDDIFKLSTIIDRANINSDIQIHKSLLYYCNRYIKHPHKLYYNYLIHDLKGSKAFIVLKKYEDGNIIKGHIIDFIKEENFELENILNVSISILKSHNAEILSLWPVNKEFKVILGHNNVKDNGFDTYFGIKFLDKEFKNLYENKLLQIDNWTLMMGDSDAF